MLSALSLDRSNIASAATSLLILVTAACSGNSSQHRAQSLYDGASAAVEAGEYVKAISQLDSIDSICPDQVDIRRSGMHLRARAIEGQTLIDLQTTDSLIAVAGTQAETLKATMTYINTNPIEGYYIATSQKNVPVESTEGLHARISPDGIFYVISSARRGTGSVAVRLSDSGQEATTPSVQPDGERNDRTRGNEIITFTQAECDTIGHFAMDHAGQPLKLTFLGSNNRTITLPSAQLEALAQTYAASSVFTRLRLLQLRKSKLEQQLTLSRSQQARTFSGTVDK